MWLLEKPSHSFTTIIHKPDDGVGVRCFFALEDPNSFTRKKKMKLKRHINLKAQASVSGTELLMWLGEPQPGARVVWPDVSDIPPVQTVDTQRTMSTPAAIEVSWAGKVSKSRHCCKPEILNPERSWLAPSWGSQGNFTLSASYPLY